MLIQKKGNKRALLFPTSSNKIILFMGGFPKYPCQNKFIELANKKNYNVLYPLYSGSFDSGGKFSINSSINDVKIWYQYLIDGKLFLGLNKKSITIKPKEIIIFSTSYGSYITDLALRKYRFNLIKKCIFLSPLFSPSLFKSDKSDAIAKSTLKIVKRSYPLTYRFENILHFFREIKGENSNPLTNKPLKTKLSETIIITGKDDFITPQDMAKQLTTEYPNSFLNIIKGGHGSKVDTRQLGKLLKKYL